MTGIKVYGHRGSPRQAFENTIESFDLAESAGADGIELDVRVTACGQLVLHHAPDFHVGSKQYMISTLTLREIRALVPVADGRPYRIPTLLDIFERYEHGFDYFVELKPCNVPAAGLYEQAVVAAIRRYGVERHVVVSSFTADLVRRVAAAAPDLPTSLIFEHPAAITGLGDEGSNFPPVRALHPKASIVDAELAERARRLGLPLHVWTVNDVPELERLRALGVASVITDEAATMLAALGRTPKAPPALRVFDGGIRRFAS